MMELLNNKRADARFYVCIAMGFAIVIIGIFCPPLGDIAESLLYATGMFLLIGGLALGLDIAGILREVRLLKELDMKNLHKMDSNEETGDVKG